MEYLAIFTIIKMFKILGIALVISKFEPLKWVVDIVPDEAGLLKWIPSLLLSCEKCLGFWTGSLLFGIWYGIAAFAIIYIISKYTNFFDEKTITFNNER